MTILANVAVGTIVGAAALCVLSTAASAQAQVRTVGPAAPFLVTGRSVSVPPYHQAGQQSIDDSGQMNRMRDNDDSGYAAPADGNLSAPK
jgi:hypothetical protein